MSTNDDQEEYRKRFVAMTTYIFEQFNQGKTNDQIVSDLVGKGLKQ